MKKELIGKIEGPLYLTPEELERLENYRKELEKEVGEEVTLGVALQVAASQHLHQKGVN